MPAAPALDLSSQAEAWYRARFASSHVRRCLATRPEDNLLFVRAKALRLQKWNDDGRILFDAGGRNSRKSAHELIDEALDVNRLPRERLRVTQAVIQAAFQNGSKRPKTVNFTVTHPAGCTLRDSDEDLILRRCLRDWGIANDE